MKTKTLVLLIFILASLSIYSQGKIRLGAKLGANFTGFHTGESIYTGKIGLSFGAMAEYKLSEKFFIQTELLYNKKGDNIYTAASVLEYDAKLSYIDVPVQIKYQFIKKVSFDLGVQTGFLINKEFEIDDNTVNIVNPTNTLDFSANFGFSFRIKENYILQTRYNFGLTDVFKNSNLKNSAIGLSLGYFLN